MSSNAMCKAIWDGVPKGAENHHPLDVDDLSRCIAMADATQPGDRIQRAATISPEWAAIMAVWDHLRSTFKRESAEMNEGSRKSFVETAELLQTALDKASQKAGVLI